jgi:hypothetical protein
MKVVNLLSLQGAHATLSPAVYDQFLSFIKASPKSTELNDLKIFISELRTDLSDFSVFDGYFWGYKIPQISKEFDLLRIGASEVVNIELKSSNTGANLFKQLVRNNYYLGFLGLQVHCFTYVSTERKLYTLDDSGSLISVDFNKLIKILINQKTAVIKDINDLFNPSNYLVSPFNSTEEFISDKYFLTAHQEEIKSECVKKIDGLGASFLSICGKAGTGKTLLTYDIAKNYINKGQKVLIIHCGKLNSGHDILRKKYGWDIIPIKIAMSHNLSAYPIVVVDETQRIRPSQLEFIIEKIKEIHGNCIFAYDKQQCLRDEESDNNIPRIIMEQTSSSEYELTDKIRTNKEIASFISALFDKNKTPEKLDREHIELRYFNNYEDAKSCMKLLGNQGWKIINFTPSNRQSLTYDNYEVLSEESSHDVIGQEFENVISVIDDHFTYVNNTLSIANYKIIPYYHPTKMLFQIMTRTRKKLCVIVIKNDEVMERCLTILGCIV